MKKIILDVDDQEEEIEVEEELLDMSGNCIIMNADDTFRNDVIFKYKENYYKLFELKTPAINVTSDMVAIMKCSFKTYSGINVSYQDYYNYLKFGKLYEPNEFEAYDILENYELVDYFFGVDNNYENLITIALSYIKSRV